MHFFSSWIAVLLCTLFVIVYVLLFNVLCMCYHCISFDSDVSVTLTSLLHFLKHETEFCETQVVTKYIAFSYTLNYTNFSISVGWKTKTFTCILPLKFFQKYKCSLCRFWKGQLGKASLSNFHPVISETLDALVWGACCWHSNIFSLSRYFLCQTFYCFICMHTHVAMFMSLWQIQERGFAIADEL